MGLFTKKRDTVNRIGKVVQNIADTFTQPGRWEVKIRGDSLPLARPNPAPRWDFTDKVTGESFEIVSQDAFITCVGSYPCLDSIECVPLGVYSYDLPDWLTGVEKEYLAEAMTRIFDARVALLLEMEKEVLKGVRDQSEMQNKAERERFLNKYSK